VSPGFVIEELLSDGAPAAAPNDLVFASPEGHPIQPTLFRRRFWNPGVEAAGLAPLRIHDLRHSAVALWIAAGGHPKQIAARAGHTSVSVVLDRYGHLLPNHEDAFMQALENLGASTAALRCRGGWAPGQTARRLVGEHSSDTLAARRVDLSGEAELPAGGPRPRFGSVRYELGRLRRRLGRRGHLRRPLGTDAEWCTTRRKLFTRPAGYVDG
jgi:hypothetical protein